MAFERRGSGPDAYLIFEIIDCVSDELDESYQCVRN